MPKIKIKNKNIFYEIHGEGEPLIILNGIMMSTLSWYPLKDVLSQNHKLVLFDMVDQGQSDKMEGERPYTQDYHVETLKELIKKLNLGKVHLFGVSYGGEVAIKFAIANGKMLNSLILANVPFKTTAMLRYQAQRWADVFRTYDGAAMYKEVNQIVYCEEFYEANFDWLEERAQFFKKVLKKEWFDGMLRLLESGDKYDPEKQLHKIKTPTLIIGSSEDRVTPNKYQRELSKRIKNSSLMIIDDAAHVLPYEKPHAFCAAILGFLQVYNKTIKTM